MKQLWSPWRCEYILAPKPDSCVFCIPETEAEDAERLILYRGQKMFVVMNKYPYNNGHLLFCPYAHISRLEDLDLATVTEIMTTMQISLPFLRKYFNCAGVNIGLNQGEAAGAGINEHLHFHLVPRWHGDSSFMAVLDDVRTVPQHLQRTYADLKPLFQTALIKVGGLE